ncbi:MAG: GspMb/PilO family protein [Bryobacterales bacterium]|nr:GspMb/PilO family protein [Bryobacterales bacterium]
MMLSPRDRRALLLLGVGVAAVLGWRVWTAQTTSTADAPTISLPIPTLEKRLVSLRERAALNPAKNEIRERLAAVVEEREKALLRADTPQQAQAALLAKVRAVLERQDPPLQTRQVDMAPIGSAGEDYGEVTVTVAFPCAIEQLVNVLADIRAMEEAVATRNLTVTMADRRNKTLNVRVTVSAFTPRELVPEPTGGLIQ